MPLHSSPRRTASAAVGALAAVVVMSLAGPAGAQHARLVAHSVLPAATFRAGSPPSGGVPLGGGTRDGRGQRRARPGRWAVSSPRSRSRASRAWCRRTPGPGGRCPTTATPGGRTRPTSSSSSTGSTPAGRSRRARVLESRRPPRSRPPHPVDDRLRPGAGLTAARLLLQRSAPDAAGVRRRSGGPHPDRLRPRPGVVRSRPRRQLLGGRGVRAIPRSRGGRRPGAGAAGGGARCPLAPEPVPRHLGSGARRGAHGGGEPRLRGRGDQP